MGREPQNRKAAQNDPAKPQGETGKPLRLFIAANLAPEQEEACADIIERLQKGMQFTKSHPKWSKPKNLHLTLKFLGDTQERRIPKIQQAMDDACSEKKPFLFRLGGLGVFPNEKKPRVIWLGMGKGKEKMTTLQKNLDAALAHIGFPLDNREFSPHLTLARLNSMRDTHAMIRVLKMHEHIKAGENLLDKICLYQSTLTPKGPVYKLLHEAKFEGKEERSNS
ncbi:MAG: RNA 2',3'-cyclic phosphodiesterase [Candidatus Sumerlaeia bacterium]